MPMDPKNPPDGPSEFGWGAGLFPPGVADTSGPDFGEDYPDVIAQQPPRTHQDNYARAVADRRTDPVDPESGRDFYALGNPDRFGGNPALVRETAPKKKRTKVIPPTGLPPLQRKG